LTNSGQQSFVVAMCNAVGPIQAILEQEVALKRQLRERKEGVLADALRRQSSLGREGARRPFQCRSFSGQMVAWAPSRRPSSSSNAGPQTKRDVESESPRVPHATTFPAPDAMQTSLCNASPGSEVATEEPRATLPEAVPFGPAPLVPAAEAVPAGEGEHNIWEESETRQVKEETREEAAKVEGEEEEEDQTALSCEKTLAEQHPARSTAESTADGFSAMGMDECAYQAADHAVRWADFHRRSGEFMQDREEFLELLRRKKQEDALRGCTFAPQISKKSSRVAEQCRSRSSGSIYDRGLNHAVNKLERLEMLRKEKEQREMAECHFQPNTRPLRLRQSLPATAVSESRAAAPMPSSRRSGSYAAVAAARRSSTFNNGAATPPSCRHSVLGSCGRPQFATPRGQQKPEAARIPVESTHNTGATVHAQSCMPSSALPSSKQMLSPTETMSVAAAVERMEGLLLGLRGDAGRRDSSLSANR